MSEKLDITLTPGLTFGPVAGGRFVARGGITDAVALPQPAG